MSFISGSFFNSTHERFGEFYADTYLKMKNITVMGHAFYNNGARHDVRFCENVDVSKVYPYLTYDAIGGNLNLERYSFGGAVDVKLGNRWNVGASLSYDAGLYYRNVDPRPRDVTGEFNICIGGAYAPNQDYRIGVNAGYQKYRQSCDISFMSELGEATIYHLTGLGTHYSRFAGLGHNSYYSGHSFAAAASLYPVSSGVYFNIGGSIEKISRILSDLNNLPLVRLDNRSADIEVGWKTPAWGITAFGNINLRHGYENIFGDASTGQYPVIASLGMDLINSHDIGVRAAAETDIKKFSLTLTPEFLYSHYSEKYRYPERSLLLDSFMGGTDIGLDWIPSERFILRTVFGYRASTCLKGEMSDISSENPDLSPFIDILTGEFEAASSKGSEAKVEIGGDYMFGNNKYAISLDISYIHLPGANDISKFTLTFSF